MSNNLKHYNCTMTVLGPVHIGSGENYRRNEYIYSNRDNSISVLDIGKAYQWFIEQGKAAEFESYFADFNPRSLPLGEWLSARRITEKEYSQWIKYKMTAGDSVVVFERGKQKYSDILAFVKDPYSLPYVPGSSIKGMLRTALAMYELSKKKNNLLKLVSAQVDDFDQMTDKEQEDFIRKNKRKFLTKEAVKIETELFNTLDFNDKRKEDGVNCNLSRLIVGDSKPLSYDALTVCKKYDVRTDGSKNELPIFKECLKPGTKIEFDLTIDESVNSKGKSIPYSIEEDGQSEGEAAHSLLGRGPMMSSRVPPAISCSWVNQDFVHSWPFRRALWMNLFSAERWRACTVKVFPLGRCIVAFSKKGLPIA